MISPAQAATTLIYTNSLNAADWWYGSSISLTTDTAGLQLVNFTGSPTSVTLVRSGVVPEGIHEMPWFATFAVVALFTLTVSLFRGYRREDLPS